jgi:adenine phosphoribosyltransferase
VTTVGSEFVRPPAALFPHLRAAVADAPTTTIPAPGGTHYQFRRYEFGEFGSRLEPELVEEIARSLVAELRRPFWDFDSLVAPEPGGHMWALMVAHGLRTPLTVLRTRSLVQNPRLRLHRQTAFSSGELFCDSPPSGERVVVVDDVVSSGGTLASIFRGLRNVGVDVVGAQVIVAKGHGWEALEAEFCVPVRSLVQV